MAKLLGWRLNEVREKRDAEIAQERASGRTFQEIADARGLTKQRVIQIAKKFGEAAAPPEGYKEARYGAEKHADLYTSGKNVSTIAAETGLSARSIYRRLKRTGTSVRPPKRIPIWERLARRTIFASGCWLWNGAHSPPGYAVLGSRIGGTPLAHRLMYMELIGPIPDGLTLDHLCRERGCVNPYHLEPVTLAENISRGVPFRGPRKRTETQE